jgi:hypothetical protein
MGDFKIDFYLSEREANLLSPLYRPLPEISYVEAKSRGKSEVKDRCRFIQPHRRFNSYHVFGSYIPLIRVSVW